jgi:hypothetical protein
MMHTDDLVLVTPAARTSRPDLTPERREELQEAYWRAWLRAADATPDMRVQCARNTRTHGPIAPRA